MTQAQQIELIGRYGIDTTTLEEHGENQEGALKIK
jgi:hypothetical protein